MPTLHLGFECARRKTRRHAGLSPRLRSLTSGGFSYRKRGRRRPANETVFTKRSLKLGSIVRAISVP